MSAPRRSLRSQAAKSASASRLYERYSPSTEEWLKKSKALLTKMNTVIKQGSYLYGELMSKKRSTPEERVTRKIYETIEEFSSKIESLVRQTRTRKTQSKARQAARVKAVQKDFENLLESVAEEDEEVSSPKRNSASARYSSRNSAKGAGRA